VRLRAALLAASVALAAADVASGAAPRFVRNIPTGETAWFSSPALADVTG
jgi:hypothetical protein